MPIGGEVGVRRRHLQGAHGSGAQHDGEHRRQIGLDAQPVGDFRNLGWTDHLRDLGVHRVDRRTGGVGQRQYSVIPGSHVAHRPDVGVFNAHRRALDLDIGWGREGGSQRHVAFQRSQESEGLHAGPGVSPTLDRQVELDEVKRQAGGHHLHGAGEIVHRDDRTGRGAGVFRCVALQVRQGVRGKQFLAQQHVLLVVGERQPSFQYPVGLPLESEVDGGLDAESPAALTLRIVRGASEDRFLALLRVVSQEGETSVVQKLAVDLRHHMIGLSTEWDVLGDLEGSALGYVGLFGLSPAVLHHLIDDQVAAIPGPLGAYPGVVEGRVPDQHRQGGCLLQGDLLQRLCEELPRGGAHSVGARPEVHRVEIELQDLVLFIGPLQVGGDEGLPYLALYGYIVSHKVVLRHLLSDGGSTQVGLVEEVVHRGPGDGGEVDSLVLVEVVILGRQHRVDHHLGNLRYWQGFGDPSVMQLRQEFSVGGVHPRDPGQVGEGQVDG